METERNPFHIMDEVLAHSDDPVQPVTVQIEARAVGRFDETRLHDALHEAMAVHPLMRAGSSRGATPRWGTNGSVWGPSPTATN